MSYEDMKVVIVGPVDYGKSAIISCLIADTGALSEGKLEQVQENCRGNLEPYQSNSLLDALKDEHTQGIIDVAHCFFKSSKRRYIIVDTPDLLNFIKIMINGTSQADVALLVIDVEDGIQFKSYRYGYLLSMLGIKHVIVLFNKMDLINYNRNVYENVVDAHTKFFTNIGIFPIANIPVSGREGDNIAASTAHMPWYQGPTVLEVLDELHAEPLPEDKPFRMSIQGVHIQQGKPRRIITGTIESGRLLVGDEVIFYPSGKKGRVNYIEQKFARAQAGNETSFTIEEQIYVSRGELVAKMTEAKPSVSTRIRVSLLWLGEKPMNTEKTYLLKLGTSKVRVKLEEIRRRMDISSMELQEGGEQVKFQSFVECILKCDKPLTFDLSEEIMATSRFEIVDDYETVGGGIVLEGMDDRNLQWHPTTVTRAFREHLNGHQGGVLWLTGLSGSGKSTLANALEKSLSAQWIRTYLLDGDNVRHGLNQDLGFSKNDRAENIRRIAEVAKLFIDAGMFVITAFISPYRADRQLARDIIGTDDFMEIHVHCSLEECERRDPKGIYKKARRGEILQFTGISSPYEAPQSPDITVLTEMEGAEEAVERILTELRVRGLI